MGIYSQLIDQTDPLNGQNGSLPSRMLLVILKVVEQLIPQGLLRGYALLHGLSHHHSLLLLLEIVHLGEFSDAMAVVEGLGSRTV